MPGTSDEFENPMVKSSFTFDVGASEGGGSSSFETEPARQRASHRRGRSQPPASNTEVDTPVMPETLLGVPTVAALDATSSAREVFEKADSDGDNLLDLDEIAALLKTLGMSLDQTQLAAAVQQMDRNGDGAVNAEQFEAWWAAHGASIAKVGSTAFLKVQEWQSLLVEGPTKLKENARDRKKRLAEKTLAESSLINPEGKFRRRWDFVQMFLLSYVAFAVPYRLGFHHPVELWSGWFWFDACVDCYFLSDILISFRTAYFNSLGELVVQKEDIRRNYLRSWFSIDLSSCFPGNYISYMMETGDGSSESRMIKLLRMLRLLKLLRLARFNRLIRRYEEEFASVMTTFKLGKLIIVIVVVGHWLSCLFYGFGSMDAADGYDADGNLMQGWVARQFSEEKCPDESCRWQKYLTSFYWATMTMTTVGYGDIVPKTGLETIACVLAMVCGGFVFGLIVGNLAELSKRANAGELLRQKAVAHTQQMLSCGVTKGKVSKDVGRNIRAYYSYQHDQVTALDLGAFILGLPADLRDTMARQMHWIDGATGQQEVFGLLHKIPFFAGLSSPDSIMVCARMKLLHVQPAKQDNDNLAGENSPEDMTDGLVMLEGQTENQTMMYIVTQGIKSVVLEKGGSRLGVLSTGDFFGELAVLLPPPAETPRPRLRSAYCIGETQLGVLDYNDVFALRRESFDINKKIVDYTNGILAYLDLNSGAADHGQTARLSLMEPFPELRMLAAEIDYKLGKLRSDQEQQFAEINAKLDQLLAK